MSDLNPKSARKGATSTGMAIIIATMVAATPSSTIITRLSVPSSITEAMPTLIWKSDRRKSWPNGSCSLTASEKGSMRKLAFLIWLRVRIMGGTPARMRCRNRR